MRSAVVAGAVVRGVVLMIGVCVVDVPMTLAQDVTPMGSASASSAARPVRHASVRRGLDRQTEAALQPIFARAKDRGLPVDALTAKAAEGALRGVPSSRIVSAVRALEERLTTAKLALAPVTLTGDLVAGADALSVGVSVDVLRAMRRRRPSTSLAVPLAVLTQLVSQGIPTNRAASIVLQLLDHGATSEQLVALRKAVNDDILAGASASRALDARAAHVLAALGPTMMMRPNAATAAAAQASGVGATGNEPASVSSHK